MSEHPLIDFDWLTRLHVNKRLRLATSEGLEGFVHLDNNPQALVTELIRLAHIGQQCELLTGGNLDLVKTFVLADEEKG